MGPERLREILNNDVDPVMNSRMHSVDSAISLRSQLHADRIRWPGRLRYPQQRSVSDLELAYRPPQPQPQPPDPPRTTDLEYLDNPAENLEFAKRKLQLRPTRPRADDEYYRHLTARNQQERERWWQSVQAPQAQPLRRSRSLAVIREEACSAPLIPRARLVDKPSYKDRFIARKYATKEDEIERIYKSTSSCYGEISESHKHSVDTFAPPEGEDIYEEAPLEDEGTSQSWPLPSKTHHSEDVINSRNPSEIDSLDSNYIHKNYNFEANHSNYKESSPDTTDQDLQSNSNAYISKPLFIRPEKYTENKEETSDYYIPEYVESRKSDSDISSNSSSIAISHANKSQTNFHVLEQSTSEDNEPDSFNESLINKKRLAKRTIDAIYINNVNSTKDYFSPNESFNFEKESKTLFKQQALPLEKDNLSVTSTITTPRTPENSWRRLENLAVSLAEKNDEYCESKYSESFIEIPLNFQSASNSFNSKSFDDLNCIYTQVKKNKTKFIKPDSKSKHTDTLERYQRYYNSTDPRLYELYLNSIKSNKEELKTRSLYRQSSSSKNITTEPFVSTLIENQYYSLPDINISKGLKRSERIDAKLREQENINVEDVYIKRLEVVYKSETPSENLSEIDENNLKEISIVEVTENDLSVNNRNKIITNETLCDDLYNSNEIDKNCLSENKVTNPYIDLTLDNRKPLVSKNYPENKEDLKSSSTTQQIHQENKSVSQLTKRFSLPYLNSENSRHKKIITDLPTIPDPYKILVLQNTEKANSDSVEGTCHQEKNSTSEITCKSQPSLFDKKRTNLTKHYSLRQREPRPDIKSHDPVAPPDPPNEEITTNNTFDKIKTSKRTESFNLNRLSSVPAKIYDIGNDHTQIQRLSSFKTRDTNNSLSNEKERNHITILPLSGHQTIIIDPPISKESIPSNGKILTKNEKILNEVQSLSHFKNESDNESEEINSLNNIHIENKEADENKTDLGKSELEFEKTQGRSIPRVKKERSFKIAEVQNKFERPPLKLIIRDKTIFSNKATEMSRPQVLTITDKRPNILKTTNESNKMGSNETRSKLTTENESKNRNSLSENNITLNKLENKLNHSFKSNLYNVTEKVDNVVKTDLEYQEKLHSVKNYWSKLIDKSGDDETESQCEETNEKVNTIRESLPDENTANQTVTVEDIIKSIETVKIVDSIKKKHDETNEDMWKKEEPEKEKAESVIEESPIKRIICDSTKLIEKACDTLKETFNFKTNDQSIPNEISETKENGQQEYKSFSPDIEIVEIGKNNAVKKCDELKHATLIRTKSYEEDGGDFDHVRYKIMKSDLFRKSMITNYTKEAQFDGLLQYLQDYSFQELLVNNNIVIIEPVRTKIERAHELNTSFKRPNSCRITGITSKQADNKTIDGKEDNNKQRKPKSGLKRHFFYHPIRVNKEIIEEELPNPDTVKTVRNLFEGTLRMRKPGESSDPCLLRDSSSSMSKKSTSHKNLSIDSKLDKAGNRKKVMRYLTIDTSYGNKKWDSASLSSGVSSGDLSSNNDHEYDTDALSPFQSNKVNTDHIYSSSSEEYLCESLNPSLCYESQYVSQDILQKIRECGTSITYYGGKVLDERSGPAVSPMTKAIMDEIRSLQRNCCRDCSVCQTKCSDVKCDCLNNTVESTKTESLSEMDMDRFSKCCSCSEITEKNDRREKSERNGNVNTKNENYLGFKFKLVKSNSCSSRLELAGTGEDQNIGRKYRTKQSKSIDDPPIIYDNENSVKTKVCRIESYRKGMVPSPFSDTEKEENDRKLKEKTNAETFSECNKEEVTYNKIMFRKQLPLPEPCETENTKALQSKDLECGGKKINGTKGITDTEDMSDSKKDTMKVTIDFNQNNGTRRKSSQESEKLFTYEPRSVAETIKSFNDPKKFYYVNAENPSCDKKNGIKFGEMLFEEFEVLDTKDNLLATKVDKK